MTLARIQTARGHLSCLRNLLLITRVVAPRPPRISPSTPLFRLPDLPLIFWSADSSPCSPLHRPNTSETSISFSTSHRNFHLITSLPADCIRGIRDLRADENFCMAATSDMYVTTMKRHGLGYWVGCNAKASIAPKSTVFGFGRPNNSS